MVTLEPPRTMPGTANPWDSLDFSRAAVMGFLKRARRAVGMAGEVDVLLAPDATLRRLNREFRAKDKATDVLSFPAVEGMPGNRAGDLAVSFQIAARQADRFGHTVFEEVCILILHGLLHLNGMDHEADTGEMAVREAELRAKLWLPVGLIARVEASESGNAKGAKERRKGREATRKHERVVAR